MTAYHQLAVAVLVIETVFTEQHLVFNIIPNQFLAVDTIVQSIWNFPAFTIFTFFEHGAFMPLAPKKIITFLCHIVLPAPLHL